jgi:imidazolonepropionase-like amidohydrolase
MRKTRLKIFLYPSLVIFLCAALFPGGEEKGEALLIKGAKIYTMGPKGVLLGASLLIEGGKIKKIIEGLDWPQAQVVDYSGKCIIPGLVDAHTYISGYYRLLENSQVVTSDLVALAAFDPLSPEVDEALAAGITTANLCPRNENLVGGITSILKLSKDPKGVFFLKKEGFLKISFAKDVERDDRAPTSLMGAKEMLDESLKNAGNQGDREEIFQEQGILKLAKGELQPLIAASNYEEINTALKWLSDWKKKGVIVGGEEVYRFIEELNKKEISILLSPFLFAFPDRIFEKASSLLKLGIKIAFVSDMPEGEASGLRTSALLLFHQEMPQEEALKTITLYPAQILGVESVVGSLEEGKDADFVVFSGEPLDLSSKILAVYSSGRLVSK